MIRQQKCGCTEECFYFQYMKSFLFLELREFQIWFKNTNICDYIRNADLMLAQRMGYTKETVYSSKYAVTLLRHTNLHTIRLSFPPVADTTQRLRTLKTHQWRVLAHLCKRFDSSIFQSSFGWEQFRKQV